MTVFLIDGYNVMHELCRSQGLDSDGQLAAGQLADERARLLDRVASYRGGTSDRAIVVFDSSNASLQKGQSATANVQVYFGSLDRSADAIIERATYALSAAENVVVVSSDYGLQKTIFVRNVTRCSSRQFVSDLQHHTREVANSENCTRMMHRVEDRIDSESLESLRELRRRLEEDSGGGRSRPPG